MDSKTLGERLKMARIAQLLTLKELADRTGVSCSHLSELERGRLRKPPIYALPAIALHYGIPYEELTALSTWTALEKKAITPTE